MVIYLKHENIGMLTEIKNRIERYVAVNHGFDQVAMQFDIN